MAIQLTITPLPLLQRSGRALLQAVRVAAVPDQRRPGARFGLVVRRGHWRQEFDLGLAANPALVFLPEAQAPTDTEFVLSYGGEVRREVLVMERARHWTVHLVLHSHTDLGFTAPVSEVAHLHNENTDQAVAFCQETASWPAGLRFKWTCEVSWQVQNYLRARRPQQVEALMELVRNGSIAVGALHSGEHTELLGHEEAVRSLAFAGHLRRRFGIPCDTVLLSDVPGCTAGFVQVMAKSGIANLLLADNNFVAPFLRRTDLPRPFFWEGADGTDVLCWFTDHPYYAYVEGEHYGFLDSCDRVRDVLGPKLAELEAAGYPYNRFQVQHAFDNARITFRPAEIVRQWAELWEQPKIVLSTAREFLSELRAEHGPRIPRRRGDWTSWWGSIVAGFPVEESLTRRCHDRAPAVETLAAQVAIRTWAFDYPVGALGEVYDGLLAFDEHSGGGAIYKPRSRADQDRALREGFGFVHQAAALLSRLEAFTGAALGRLIAHPGGGEAVAVYNPSPAAAAGIVEAKLPPAEGAAGVVDAVTGAAVPAAPGPQGLVRFQASDVPAYGYRVYRVVRGPADAGRRAEGCRAYERTGDVVIESEDCRAVLRAATGRCTSVAISALGRDIVRGSGSLNQPLVYVARPVRTIELGKYIPEIYDGTHHPGDLAIWPVESRPRVTFEKDPFGRATARVSHEIGGVPWLLQEYTVAPGRPGLLITNRLRRVVRTDRRLAEHLAGFLAPDGLLYFGFPFHVPGGRFEYEAPGLILRPSAAQFKGACHDYFAVQRWCAIVGEDYQVVLTAPDTPLVDVGSIGLLRFKDRLDEDQSSLFVRAVSLREWGGEDESPYSRAEDVVVRFALTAIPRSASPQGDPAVDARLEAYRFAVGGQPGLRALRIPPGAAGLLPATEHRLFGLSPDHVEVMTLKRAEEGGGYVVRLREVAGRAAEARLSFPGLVVQGARQALMTEEPLGPLPHAGDGLAVRLEPFAIATLLLDLAVADARAAAGPAEPPPR